MSSSYKLKSYFSKEWFSYNFLVLISYYFTAIFGMNYIHYEGATPIWAPAGIVFATVFIFGYKIWPAIFLGAYALNYPILSSLGSTFLEINLSALLCAGGNTLVVLIGYYTVSKLTDKSHPFKNIHNIIIFLFFGMIVPALLNSLTGGLTYSNITNNWNNFFPFWLNWFLGDLGGIIILTPLILNFKKEELLLTKVPKLIEFILLTIFLYFIINLFFVVDFILPLSIVLPVILIFIFRFGKFETALSVFILSIFSIWILNNPNNIFYKIYPYAPLIPLTFSLISISVTSIVVSTVLSEDRHKRNELLKKNTELNQWYQITLDREERNIELKKEVNELLKKLGTPKKYLTK
ncbi:MAG: MASE1 domain-containing protein [Flavobacteriaceae bacterium]|nr:MASE1 domain-containing protein [Flavobacteriaceae bacterium]